MNDALLNATVLVVDDEPLAVKNLQHVLEKEGYRVVGASDGASALKVLDEESVDLVLTDVRMAGMDGYQLLTRVRQLRPEIEVVVITGFATLEAAVEAMRLGAFYYIAKPFRLDELRKVVREAIEKVQLKRENRRLREQLEGVQGKVELVTQDPALRRLLETARQVAPTNCSILITGESGTGKELLARYIHGYSRRIAGPFLAVNCGAFGEELLGNELFGHEKGAFTGASSAKAGVVEAANGGTLFLDEVTEMSPSMQVKLLRVVQEREVLRLGATRPLTVDVRFLAASNRDVGEAVRNAMFRQDLYFRLNVVNLHMPPLRERPHDIPLLVHYFLKKYADHMRKPVHETAPEALRLLTTHLYPGNVRELENIVARGVALANDERIEVRHLPEDLRETSPTPPTHSEGKIASLADQEEAYLRWVLQQTSGNKSQAARMLGIDRVSLWRKLKKSGLS